MMIAHGSKKILHCSKLTAVINPKLHAFDGQVSFENTYLETVRPYSLDRILYRMGVGARITQHQVRYTTL